MLDALSLFDNSNDYRMTALRRVQDAAGGGAGGTGDTTTTTDEHLHPPPQTLQGKVIVVTGGTGSLGKQLATAFVQGGGATVVLTGRSAAKGEQVKQELLDKLLPQEDFQEKYRHNIVPMVLDLADLDSVKTFAETLQQAFPQGIHALINNAGMIATKFQLSQQGKIESSLQTNFVSQVLLTELLIPQLEKAKRTTTTFVPRIVNLSSLGHADASNPINWDAIPSTLENFVGGYNKEYFEAKWLMTAYTAHLARRFSSDGSSSTTTLLAVSADPGVSPEADMWDQVVWPVRFLARYVFKALFKTPPQAAACAAHLAVADAGTSNLRQGGYYQSGVLLEKPMRPDCSSVDEWKQAVLLLNKCVPKEYAPLLVKLDA